MSVKITEYEEVLVFSSPVNEQTKKWGVYAIPRLWRETSGSLVVRFNGEMDSGDTDNNKIIPDLFFESFDEGKTWNFVSDGVQRFNLTMFNGITSPYTWLKNSVISFRDKEGVSSIENVEHVKEFTHPNGEAILYAYRYGDIPIDCKGFEMVRHTQDTEETVTVNLDFPEREILVNGKGLTDAGYVDVKKTLRQSIYKNPYFSSVTELNDGTLVAVSCGQNPDITEHYSGVAYLVESTDGGCTWRKRSIIASDGALEFGYTGDGHETSLVCTSDGTLVCAMRMEMSIHPDKDTSSSDTMVTYSTDNGYTWCKPFPVSDSSVTPQLVALDDGIVFLAYGRPGVHYIISEDNGKTWSKSRPVIGKTLEECRAEGMSDADSKYFNTWSYSNVFVEKSGNNSVIVLYNNQKYKEDDGLYHKAGFVKKKKIKNIK